MALPPLIAQKVSYPVPTVLEFLQSLAFPRGFGLAAPGDIDSAVYGTAVPARRNFKPFIVGLIPPDLPVDFVPFRRLQSELGAIESFPPVSAAPQRSSTSLVINSRPQSTNDGLVPRVRKNAPLGEVRQAIYDSYLKYVKTPPTEVQVNLIAAHIIKERGLAGGGIPTWNYNFGNQIAPGEKRGTYSDEYNTLGKRKEKGLRVEDSPDLGIATPPTPPSGGTYYLSTEYDGRNTAYPGYYSGYQSAAHGVDSLVYLLANRYPAAITSSNVQDYTAGLLDGVGGRKYFEASPAVYEDRMGAHYDTVTAGVASGKYGGQIGSSGVEDPVGSPTVETSQDVSTVSIMAFGASTQLESGPAGDRIGKFVEYDPERAEVARRLTDDLRRQIAAIAATPGLLLLVNPSEFTRTFEPTVDNTVKGRTGNIVHVWLEKPTSLSCSGVTAGQYVVDPAGDGGITGQLRVFSASYQNLLSLLAIYKANGVIYSGLEDHPGLAQLGYSVFIYFDNFIYVGSFDSFSIQDSDTKPHNMAYDFKFNVRYFFDVGNDGRFTDFDIGVNNGYFPQRY